MELKGFEKMSFYVSSSVAKLTSTDKISLEDRQHRIILQETLQTI